MKYTKEKLESMSEIDLNFNVAKLSGNLLPIPKWCEPLRCGDKMCYYDNFRNVCDRHPDYCDSTEDMMTLAFDCMIGIEPTQVRSSKKKGKWCARNGRELMSALVFDDNPLRACAILYILIKQSN